MEFTFISSIYVEERDIVEMCLLCKEEGYTPRKAFNEVAMSWDDCDYFVADYIADDVVKEIKRRLEALK